MADFPAVRAVTVGQDKKLAVAMVEQLGAADVEALKAAITALSGVAKVTVKTGRRNTTTLHVTCTNPAAALIIMDDIKKLVRPELSPNVNIHVGTAPERHACFAVEFIDVITPDEFDRLHKQFIRRLTDTNGKVTELHVYAPYFFVGSFRVYNQSKSLIGIAEQTGLCPNTFLPYAAPMDSKATALTGQLLSQYM